MFYCGFDGPSCRPALSALSLLRVALFGNDKQNAELAEDCGTHEIFSIFSAPRVLYFPRVAAFSPAFINLALQIGSRWSQFNRFGALQSTIKSHVVNFQPRESPGGARDLETDHPQFVARPGYALRLGLTERREVKAERPPLRRCVERGLKVWSVVG